MTRHTDNAAICAARAVTMATQAWAKLYTQNYSQGSSLTSECTLVEVASPTLIIKVRVKYE